MLTRDGLPSHVADQRVADDGFRIDVDGEGARDAALPSRRCAARAADDREHGVPARSWATTRKVLVDCQGFRRDKDAELKQMAKFLAEKALSSGAPQEMGPLNSYERRIVHMAVRRSRGSAPRASATRR